MVITKDLGAVSAYAYAVEQGYQGTEEEFAELMARQATVAEEAAASADAAAESANEAQASAEQAEQSAQSISGDVERAEQAATTATGKATEAAQSAATANGAAQTATGKSSEASAFATAAANSASAAATSASNAAASATAAQTAKTAAETAQGKAEDAQAAAEAAAASIDPDTLVKKTELEDYAKIDGSYETMTVGNAEQLVATVGVDDSTPYNFRTSGGSVDIGDRETVNAVVGGTVAWNQIVKNGNFADTSNWSASAATISASGNVLTVTKSENTAEGVGYARQSGLSFTVGHKYIMSVSYKGIAGKKLTLFSNNSMAGMTQIIPADSDWHTVTRIVNVTATPSVPGILWLNYTTTTADNVAQFKDYNIIDLTQMFGSTIADYIYTLEQGTAGAGAAWFKKLFPKPYYAYNAGELLSVSGLQSHDMVGFNAWDEEWELGVINSSTGANEASTTNIRTKNFIRLVPNATYYIKTPTALGLRMYDADKNYIGYLAIVSGTRLFDDNVAYLRFVIPGTTTYNHDICINLSWDGERDGEYEPYKEWVYPLDSSLTLRGIPKLDASGNLYYDGDTYAPDGTVTRRYASVDLGSLTYTAKSMSNNRTAYTTPFSGLDGRPFGSNSSPSDELCPSIISTSKFTQINQGAASWAVGSFVYVWSTGALPGNTIGFITNTNDYADAATFKTAMSGVYLVYELATPTTETAEPYTQIQSVDDFGTEEYTDYAYENGDRDVAIPVGHKTVYSPNLRAKLEMSPNSPDGDGLYVVEQSNGQNEYVPLVIPTELPTAPSEDGTYTLKITVSGGTVTKSWIAEE